MLHHLLLHGVLPTVCITRMRGAITDVSRYLSLGCSDKLKDEYAKAGFLSPSYTNDFLITHHR